MSDVDAQMDALVTRAVTKDADAIDQLLRVIRPLVVRYCRTRLGGYERANTSADDVAQEVCLAVLRALPSYREQGKPFLAFVYGIAQHKVVDAHRSAGRDRSDPVDELPEDADHRDGPEEHALHLSASADMQALLEKLPEKQREVLRLRIVVGLSAEETAQAVGSSPGAVRVAQHRALSRLRQLISEGEEGDDGGPSAPSAPRRAPARPEASRPAPRPAPAPGPPSGPPRGRGGAPAEPGPPAGPRPAPRPPVPPAGGSPAGPSPVRASPAGGSPARGSAAPAPGSRAAAGPRRPSAPGTRPLTSVPDAGQDPPGGHRSPAARTGDDDLDRLLDLADANSDRESDR